MWRVAIGKGVMGGGGGRIPDFGPKLYTVVSLFSITVLVSVFYNHYENDIFDTMYLTRKRPTCI